MPVVLQPIQVALRGGCHSLVEAAGDIDILVNNMGTLALKISLKPTMMNRMNIGKPM